MTLRRNLAIPVLAALAACLPEAGPGLGRHVVADRWLADASLSPGEQPLIVYGRLPVENLAGRMDVQVARLQLWAVAGAAREPWRLGLDATSAPLSGADDTEQARPARWDSAGRICLRNYGSQEQLCVDPGTSAVERLRARSTDGAVSLLWTDDDRLLVRDEAGQTHDLGAGASTAQLRGRDVYWLAPASTGRTLRRLRAGVVAELATAVLDFELLTDLPDGPLLVASSLPAARGQWEALDPARGSRTLLMGTSHGAPPTPVASSDGRWVAYASAAFHPSSQGVVADDVELRALRLEDGLERVVSVGAIDLATPTGAETVFDPAGRELWASSGTGVFALDLDAGTMRMSEGRGLWNDGKGLLFGLARPQVVLARGYLHAGQATSLVPVDDLGSPGVAIGDDYSYVESVRVVDPTTVLVLASVGGTSRVDAWLVDVTTGTKRTLAERITKAPVVSDGRVLVIARSLASEVGDLVLFDVAAGTDTTLSRNVRSFSIQPACPACGRLAPGARVAYVVHAGRASPQDGLWLATLP